MKWVKSINRIVFSCTGLIDLIAYFCEFQRWSPQRYQIVFTCKGLAINIWNCLQLYRVDGVLLWVYNKISNETVFSCTGLIDFIEGASSAPYLESSSLVQGIVVIGEYWHGPINRPILRISDVFMSVDGQSVVKIK